MRLARRLTAYLLLAVGVVFGIDTYQGVTSHLELFDADMRRDERMLGGALARMVERSWREDGKEAAFERLAALDEDLGELAARVVYLDRERGDPLGPALQTRALEAVSRQRTLTHVRAEGDPEARLYTYVPLDVPGSEGVALEVTEPLSHETRYLRDRVRRKLATAAAMAAAAGVVAWLVGIHVVGRPVQALVEKAHQIGRGDFSRPLVLPHENELAELAREMNQMASELDAATRRVREESKARIEALEHLRHADRLNTVGRLAAGLAHELGTPLNVVSGRAKMIANGELESAEEGVESARIIAQQAERMTRIVRQLLDFARRRPVEKRAVDLGGVLRHSVALLEPLAIKQRVDLHCAIPPEPVVARIDEVQIEQALTNLVLNAIQASPRDSAVEICVSRREHPGELPPAGARAGPWAVIEVRDRGVGIASEALPQVFDPFYTTKPVGEGTGLGLSVAHGIALEHGGWIEVESEPGCGSRFRLWLPQESA